MGESLFDFSMALRELKAGKKVTRSIWPSSFLYLVPASSFEVNRPPLLGIYQEGVTVKYQAHIDIALPDASCGPAALNSADLMADDWMIVE